MPIKMVTVQVGGKTLALRVKAADDVGAAGGRLPVRHARGDPAHADPVRLRPARSPRQFHMNNVPAALDIAFIKADGRIFSILKMDPSPTNLYGPMGTFRFALEARAGFYESQGIRQGEARLWCPAAAERRALIATPTRSRHKHRLWAVLALSASFMAGARWWSGCGRAASPSSRTPPTCSWTRRGVGSEPSRRLVRRAPGHRGEDLRLLSRRDPRRPRQRRRPLRPRPRHPRQGVRAARASARGGRAGPSCSWRSWGSGVNLLAAWLLHAGAGESLNVRSAYLEVLGDARRSSAAVIVAGGVILVTGWSIADPLASAAIAIVHPAAHVEPPARRR